MCMYKYVCIYKYVYMCVTVTRRSYDGLSSSNANCIKLLAIGVHPIPFEQYFSTPMYL